MPSMGVRCRYSMILTSAGMLAALLAQASYAQQRQPAAGMLLVSTTQIEDPEFDSTVVLVVLHSEDGTVGVMLNRPTNVDPAEAFPQTPSLDHYRGTVFYGGPVGIARPVALIRSATPPGESSVAVLGEVYLSGDLESLGTLPVDALEDATVRVYAGHAEWGPGQLAAEIAAGNWVVAIGRIEQVFSAQPLELWEQSRFAGSEEVVLLR